MLQSYPLIKSSLLTSIATLLLACDTNNQSSALDALPRVSLDADLQGIYKQTCVNCHENSAVKAPQTGNTQHWQIVFNKPLDLILDRVINGYGGMPPLGQCFECDAQQLETLIHYMSRPGS